MRFDGATFHQQRDGKRLTKQYERVRDLMLDGRWRTLTEIAEQLKVPEASVSARLRDLRKPRFGGFLVEREYVDAGLYRYRLRSYAPIEPLTAPLAEPIFTAAETLFDPVIASRPLSPYEVD